MSYKDPKGLLEEIKLLVKTKPKSQSAMEYLMTYGWSILIIAVVLGALSFLGIFNPLTFAPKASPGNCQVVKNTQLGVSNLVGSCNNQVPQYVAQFNGASYITANIPSIPVGAAQRTITMWLKSNKTDVNTMAMSYGSTGGCGTYNFYGLRAQSTGSYWFDQWCTGGTINSVNINGAWNFVALEYNGTYFIMYVLNNSGTSMVVNKGTAATNFSEFTISPNTDGNRWHGYISNVQIYNTSMANTSIQTMYKNGIGASPIDLQNLVAWYPLNGNTKDYSGNNNQGLPYGVKFANNWYGGYTLS